MAGDRSADGESDTLSGKTDECSDADTPTDGGPETTTDDSDGREKGEKQTAAKPRGGLRVGAQAFALKRNFRGRGKSCSSASPRRTPTIGSILPRRWLTRAIAPLPPSGKSGRILYPNYGEK